MTTKQKQLPRCAKVQTNLTYEKNNYASIVRRQPREGSAPYILRGWQTRLAKAKASLESAKQTLIDHEAEHAG